MAKNTEQLYSQWLYNRHTDVIESSQGKVTIDNRDMLDQAYTYDMLGNLVLAVQLEEGQHVSNDSLNGNPISAYFEEAEFGYIYLPKLDNEVYKFTYEIGAGYISRFINDTGT